jgi:putative ABC transport system ATP-binding protein
MALLERLNAGGLTVIIVTHEADIAAHARRLIRLRDGRIIEDVPVAQSAWLKAAAHGAEAQ